MTHLEIPFHIENIYEGLYHCCLGHKLNSQPSNNSKAEQFIKMFYFQHGLRIPEIIWAKSPIEMFNVLEKRLCRSNYDGGQICKIDMIDFSLWKILRRLNLPYKDALPALHGFHGYWKEVGVSTILEKEIEQIKSRKLKEPGCNEYTINGVWNYNSLWHRLKTNRNLMGIELIRETAEKEGSKKMVIACDKIIEFVRNCFGTIQLVDACITCENPIEVESKEKETIIKFGDGFEIKGIDGMMK